VLLRASNAVAGPLAQFGAPDFETHLRQAWTAAGRGSDTAWRAALRRGGVYEETAAAASVGLAISPGGLSYTPPAFDGDGDLVFAAYPPSTLYDGRGANRPVLRELPDPATKITWHSWIEVHPDTARGLNVREGEILRLTSPHGEIEAPAYICPGIHPGLLAMPLGLGHTEYGQFAKGSGVNALDLLDAGAVDGFLPYMGTRVSAEQTGGYHQVAKTEGNVRQLGRGVAAAMTASQVAEGLTLAEAERQEGHGHHEVNTPLEVAAMEGFRESQLEKIEYGAYAREHPQWGMTIDLARCTGCSACVTACYMENNIPTVGEQDVLKGREMSWMRIERYYEGGEDGEPLETRFVPMPCQHCENAPCEPVCPVYAAYHTADGLNGQVYNRCVGTRYCANNCPYKVRYFNWYAYGEQAFPEPLNLQLNPDVVVRARGVME
ncbi:MAG: molybdopterin dinucleotide binding domain-containing protein, partial [Gemmatimonadales bacterium]